MWASRLGPESEKATENSRNQDMFVAQDQLEVKRNKSAVGYFIEQFLVRYIS